MTFSAYELLRFGTASKVHLFTVAIGSLAQRYCTGTRDLTIDGNTYLATPGIERSAIRQSNERAKNRVTVKFPYLRNPFLAPQEYPVTQDLGDLWFPYPPGQPVYVSCASVYPADPDQEIAERWTGRVEQPKFLGDTMMELSCTQESARVRARGQGPRLQRGCYKTLFSLGLDGCNLDPDVHAVTGELTDVTGLTLTCPAFATATLPLNGGFLRWTRTNGLVERRSIMSHSGSIITIPYGGLELEEGLEVYAAIGCPRNWQACLDRENTDNWGGNVYKPRKTPMDGTLQ